MWDANSNDGTRQPAGWKSGLTVFKLKMDVTEYTNELASEHLWETQEEWSKALDSRDVGVALSQDLEIYAEVNTITGKIEVVGVNGHPLDKTKKFR